MKNSYYVYIISNKSRTVLYTGVTNNLERRLYEHRNNLIKGFTSKYEIKDLLYYESYSDITIAIELEKQIKSGSRKKKFDLIKSKNKELKDLCEQLSLN